MADLEYKLQYVTGGANEIVITGANLRIVNGLGNTETTNGLGNLIVGYNESRLIFPECFPPSTDPKCRDTRTGSHNVVVGRLHNFSSFGGWWLPLATRSAAPLLRSAEGIRTRLATWLGSGEDS